jgi:hypothetical protein
MSTLLARVAEARARELSAARDAIASLQAQDRSPILPKGQRWSSDGELRSEVRELRDEIRALRAAPEVGDRPEGDDDWRYDERSDGGYL